MAELAPLVTEVEDIVLIEAHAHRPESAVPSGKRNAEITFGFDDANRSGDVFRITTTNEVVLKSEDGTEFGRTWTKFLVQFTVRPSLPEELDDNDAARIQLAAAEATHPNHRALVIQLTTAFEISPYRLTPTFDRREFLEQLDRHLAAQEPAAASIADAP